MLPLLVPATKLVPLTVSVVFADPAAMVFGVNEEMVGALTVKLLEPEVSSSVATVTLIVPATSSALGTVALSCFELT